GAGRELVQESRRASRAEGGLTPSASEGTRDVRALALLEQDDEDQEETDHHVDDHQGGIDEQGASSKRGVSLAAVTETVKRARPGVAFPPCPPERGEGPPFLPEELVYCDYGPKRPRRCAPRDDKGPGDRRNLCVQALAMAANSSARRLA